MRVREEPTSAAFLKKASTVAHSYGFLPLEALISQKQRTKLLKGRVQPLREFSDPFRDETEEILTALLSAGKIPMSAPLQIYHRSLAHRDEENVVRFGLLILGSRQSITEALIIKTALTILHEVEKRTANLYVNSIGDRDCVTKFSRDASAYFRKYAEELGREFKSLRDRDPFHLLEALRLRKNPLHQEAPKPLAYLSEKSRRHLRETLEYLEGAGIMYEIDSAMLGPRDMYSETVFEIREMTEEENAEGRTLARGGRCDEFIRNVGQAQIPAVGIAIEYPKRGAVRHALTLSRRPHPPRVCFIQIGFEARARSLSVLDVFRTARIPVCQPLSAEKLTAQLEYASKLNIPYTVIMGQREAIDNTVIVREMMNQSQHIVPLHELPNYLRHIR